MFLKAYMKNKILIVEDSQLVAKVLLHIARQELDFEIKLATSFAEAKKIYEEISEEIFAALVDLNLPDAKEGEFVDYMLERKVPTIVLTGNVQPKIRETLLKKGIVDYVNKEGRYSYQYAVRMINRIKKNESIKVLVVEDSKVMRKQIVRLLNTHHFQVYEAEDGVEAIKVFLENSDIRILITDYNMPRMDGFELVKNLRHKYERFNLAILGLSAEGQGSLSAKFIKSGANDFLTKPFNPEEFYCRINQSLESIEFIEFIRDAAKRDYLTNVYSRRHFFEKGEELWRDANHNSSPLAVAIINIDNFKDVNEKYGHANSDEILKKAAQLLEASLGRFILARSSGKEFYALLPGLDNVKAVMLLDKVRSLLAKELFSVLDESTNLTCSIGVSNFMGERLQDQISDAEEYMIRAKQAGKNIVLGEDEQDSSEANTA